MLCNETGINIRSLQEDFHEAARWLSATRDLVESCRCEAGCPACVQSPKCGNGNEPLDKAGAVAVLEHLLSERSVVVPSR